MYGSSEGSALWPWGGISGQNQQRAVSGTFKEAKQIHKIKFSSRFKNCWFPPEGKASAVRSKWDQSSCRRSSLSFRIIVNCRWRWDETMMGTKKSHRLIFELNRREITNCCPDYDPNTEHVLDILLECLTEASPGDLRLHFDLLNSTWVPLERLFLLLFAASSMISLMRNTVFFFNLSPFIIYGSALLPS